MPDVQRTKEDHGCPRVPHCLPQRGRMIEVDWLPMMAASFDMIQNRADLLSGQSTASTSGKQVDERGVLRPCQEHSRAAVKAGGGDWRRGR